MADRTHHRSARSCERLDLLSEPGEHLVDREQLDQVRDTVLVVQHVIERCRQPVDIMTVDRHHEGRVQGPDDAMRECIALVLQPADLRGVLGRVRKVVNEREQLPRPVGSVARGRVEQIVEDELSRDHLERHGRSSSSPASPECGRYRVPSQVSSG